MWLVHTSRELPPVLLYYAGAQRTNYYLIIK